MGIVQNPKFGKTETAFNIRLNNLHAKFTLIEQLSNIHTTDKGNLDFQLKHCEDFWIQKLETLTPKGLN